MTQVEDLNYKLHEQFVKNRNGRTLEKYVMSELLSPIQDYYNAINIIDQNQDIIEGFNLYFIAAYLCVEWMPEKLDFLEMLNSKLDCMGENDKAIIYYLNAIHLANVDEGGKNSKNYISNLQQSIVYSKGMNFVNNRLALSYVLTREKSKEYKNAARDNIVTIMTEDYINNITEEQWLSSQFFIDEFILGTSMTAYRFETEFAGIE